MTKLTIRNGLIRLATWIYRWMLLVYPPAFREQYGREMVQTFESTCRYSSRSRDLPLLWLRALVDLIKSGWAERAADRNTDVPERYLYICAVFVSVVVGYIHLRADSDQTAIALLLGGAFLCGLISPTGAWRWALITAAGIPVALLLGHGLSPASFPHRDADLPLPASLLPGLIGAYSGTMIRRLVPWSGRRASTLSPD